MSDSYVFVSCSVVSARCNDIITANQNHFEQNKKHAVRTLMQSETVGWFWNRRKITEIEAENLMYKKIMDWESGWGNVWDSYSYIKTRAEKFYYPATNCEGNMQLSINDYNWLFKPFNWEK